jgi:hypothetical protein
MKNKLVRYCPGDACGSPALLTEADAMKYEKQDTTHLFLMREVGIPFTHLPHIGGHCGACKPASKLEPHNGDRN